MLNDVWGQGRLPRSAFCFCLLVSYFAAMRVAKGQDQGDVPPHAHEPLASILGAPPLDALAPVPPLADSPEARELLEAARLNIEDGRFQRALDLTQQALGKPGGQRGETYYLAALAKSRLGRFNEALQSAEQAAHLQHGDADIHFLLGQLYRGQGRLDLARAHYRTVTLAANQELNNPKITRAWFALGQLLEQDGYDLAAAQAYEQFDRALWETHTEQRNASEFVALLAGRPRGMTKRRVELLQQTRLRDEALRVAEWACTIWPDDADTARLHVQTLLDAERANEALSLARTWLERGASAETFLPPAIEAAAQAGALESWLEDLTARVLDGNEIEVARQLIQALRRVGDDERLDRVGTRLLEKWPGDEPLTWAVAGARRRAGRIPETLQTLAQWVRHSENLIALPPERLTQWRRWFASEASAGVLGQFSRETSETDFATDFVLGVTALAADDPILADQYLNSCLEKKPGFAPAYVARGEMYLAADQYEQAKLHAEKILAEHPDQTAALYLLARACEGLDENERVEELLKQCLKQHPDEPLYNLALAQHYRRLGNLRGAQRYFQQVLSENPGNGEALEGVIDCYLRAGKIEIANAAFDKLERDKIPADALRRVETLMRHLDDPFGPAHMADLEVQLELHPEDVATARMLAGGLFYRGDMERTRRVVETILARFPEDYHLSVLLGNVEARLGDYDSACARLEALLRRFPNRLAVMQPLAMAYLNDFHLAEGRALLQRLIAADPDSAATYYLQLLQSHLEFGECDAALELLRSRAAEQAEDEEAQFQRLAVLLDCGRRDEAFELLEKRLEENPVDQRREEFIRYGVETGHYQEVTARIREWLKDNPANAGLTQALITVLLRGERPEEALEVARKFEGTHAESLLRRIWLGQCQAAMGNFDAALAEFEALLDERVAAAGLRREVRFRMITVYEDAGRHEEGLEKCDQWLRAGPDDPELTNEILQYKRYLYQGANRDAEAAGVLEVLLQENPNDAGLLNDLGYTWIDMGVNLERGTEMIRKAVAAQPWNAPFLDSLGWAYYMVGDFSNARKYLERAVRLREGRDAVIYDHLGDAAFRLGDVPAARRAWEQAVQCAETASTEAERRRWAAVLTQVRIKLAALERHDKPKTAPTAAEQNAGIKP